MSGAFGTVSTFHRQDFVHYDGSNVHKRVAVTSQDLHKLCSSRHFAEGSTFTAIVLGNATVDMTLVASDDGVSEMAKASVVSLEQAGPRLRHGLGKSADCGLQTTGKSYLQDCRCIVPTSAQITLSLC